MAEHLISARDIALLANVQPCTVRMWRSRWLDFPRPVAVYGLSPVYTEDVVWEWLIKHKKIVVEEEA